MCVVVVDQKKSFSFSSTDYCILLSEKNWALMMTTCACLSSVPIMFDENDLTTENSSFKQTLN